MVEPQLFLPPVTPKQMAGLTLEKVVVPPRRDGQHGLGRGGDRAVCASAAGSTATALRDDTMPPAALPPPLPEGVDVRYELGTDVPWNWRPFLPVHLPGSVRSIKLRRSRMPGPNRPIRGRVLAVPGPYDLFEEEVPRAGAQVSVAFQRTRWAGGTIHLWLGRRATTGRGEGSSGLVFDQVREPGDERHVR